MTTKIPVELSSTPGIVDGSNATAITIDSSERVGVGTASPSHMLHVNAADGASDNTQAMTIENNEATDGRSYGLKIKAGSTANDASLFVQDHDASNDHFIIRGNGNVGIGTTSPAEKLSINNASGNAYLQCISGNGNLGGVWIGDQADNFVGGFFYDNAVDASLFYVNNAERMRIDSSGRLLIGATSNLRTNEKLQVDGAEGVVARATANGGGCFVGLESSGNSAGGAFYGMTSGGTINFKVAVGGNVTNTNNSYGQISDIKLKENIVDATNKLDELKKIKIRNFNFIGDDTKQIGVIAQELETIFPALVTESDDVDADGNNAGTTTKEVKYSVLLPIAIKAIQEQQEQIEQLKTEIQTLKGE